MRRRLEADVAEAAAAAARARKHAGEAEGDPRRDKGSFERLLEVVGREDADRQAARERYRFYRERGYRMADHDLAGEARGG